MSEPLIDGPPATALPQPDHAQPAPEQEPEPATEPEPPVPAAPGIADTAHIAVFGWPCDRYTPPALEQAPTLTAATRFLLDTERARWDIRHHVPLWPVPKWVATEFRGHTIWVDLRDNWVAWGVLHDDWETDEVDFMRATLRPGDGMVDVGANVGVYTLSACQVVGPEGHVTAFEPNPRTAAMLARSVHDNAFGSRCTVVPTALTATAGELNLHIPETNPGASHLVADGNGIRIPARPLDSITLPRRTAFLKIDIEGHEPAFLEGARRTLAEHRPLILTEFYPRALRQLGQSSAEAYIAALQGLGYECTEFDRGFGKPVTPETAGTYPEDADPINLLCRPR